VTDGMNIQRGPARNTCASAVASAFWRTSPGTRGTSDIDIVSKVTGHG
jgi:hypothetical protein